MAGTVTPEREREVLAAIRDALNGRTTLSSLASDQLGMARRQRGALASLLSELGRRGFVRGLSLGSGRFSPPERCEERAVRDAYWVELTESGERRLAELERER